MDLNCRRNKWRHTGSIALALAIGALSIGSARVTAQSTSCPPPAGPPPSCPPSGPPPCPPMTPQQMLGWIATSNSEGYFDWTGLTYTLTYTYHPGGGEEPPVQVHYALFGDATYFGPPNILSATMQVRGNPSTYKWQWTAPPVPRTGNPDESNFPAPPLFTLGKVQGMIQGYAGGPSVHIKGSLSVDGQGWTQCSTDPTSIDFWGIAPLSPQSASLLSRSVLPANSFSDLASVEITPKVDLHGETFLNLVTDHPIDSGGLRFRINDDAFAILLAGPNPFGVPQMGDGTNLFVYDGSDTGVLRLPMSATVVGAIQGATQDDTQWLVDNNKVGWKIDPPIPGWITYTKQAQGNSIFPVTNGNSGVAMYAGLPNDETGFGNKQLILKVEGNDSQIAYIQTFFSALASNFPGAADQRKAIEENPFLGLPLPPPNWFYYYDKIYPAAPDAQYKDTSPSVCNWNRGDKSPTAYMIVTGIDIGNDAFTFFNLPIFKQASPYIQCAGYLAISGIHKYIYTVAHERGHKWLIENGLFNVKFREGDDWNQAYDKDSDGILNSVEEANGLNPVIPDTTQVYGGAQNGDEEVLASIIGWSELQHHKNDWKRDWADTGLQYAGLASPVFINPQWGPNNPDFIDYWGLTNILYFPWDFQAIVYQDGQPRITNNHYPDPTGSPITQVHIPFNNPAYPGCTYPGLRF